MHQLTHGELRMLAVGMRRADDRKAKRWQGTDSEGNVERAKGQPREADIEAAKGVKEEMREKGMLDESGASGEASG